MSSWTTSRCPRHGQPVHRANCHDCNAAYMKDYMRRRRLDVPARPLFERARKRARVSGLKFTISRDDIIIPTTCPVLGIPIRIGGARSAYSPSLDRIDPRRGYVPGNVRVISDRANRLKSNRSVDELTRLAYEGAAELRSDYELVAAYVRRETLLRGARSHLNASKKHPDLQRLISLLDRIFAVGLVQYDHSRPSGQRRDQLVRNA